MDSVRPKSNDTWQQSKSGQFQQRRRRVRKPSHLAFTSYQDGSTRLSMLQSLLTLYCMLALMLGVVVPITDALAQPEEHAEYRQIFYIFMHAVGIVGIVYMNSLISYYGSNYYKRICKSKVDKKLVLERDSTAATSDATESVDPEHSTALVSRNGISADEVTAAPEGTADSVQPQVLRPGRSILHQIRRRCNGSRRNSASDWFQRRKRIWKLRRTLNSGALAAVEQEKIILSGVGVNLYLRFGAIIFGFGVMMHSAFKIVDSLSKRGDSKLCLSPWFLPKHIIDLLFIVLQTYFLFKHHKVTINTQKSLIRFFLIHLAVANLCIWIKTVVYEIKTGLMHSTGKKLDRTVPNAAANFTTPSYGQSLDVANELLNISDVFNIQDQLINDGNGTARNSSCTGRFKIDKNSPSAQLGPYLYPCAVEYGLICAAICYKFFTNVGNTEAAKKSTPVSEATALPRSTTCHKSHRGLFGGLIVTICVLVPMVSLLIARQQANSEYRDLHVIAMLIIECIVLVCTTIIALFGAVNAIRKLKLSKLERHEAFDVNLLFVGLAGIVCYSLFVAISVGACMMTSPNDQNAGCQWGRRRQAQITQLTGLKALADLTESVAQTLFIMQVIQRKITIELAQKMEKPGRGITAALLLANLAMWIESVFEVQRDVAQDFLNYYFGVMPWSIIKLIFQPLIIFYRFHSTVCLSEIWVHSYKLNSLHDSQSHRSTPRKGARSE
ncbi:hypothetical protein BOX15_Mlig010096g2 [Macrostomum lignano]|uniref:Uncharacterized protein n=1 Tax=Macrostomum lignano TaxID=282301 RepID=A0A267ERH3_9PLAT|nr:hypothetical protein BOX15_Mlig010096g2 [Macrostomum lignano]